MIVADPQPVVLTAAPDISVARPALGLTVYLAEPGRWAHEQAGAVFDAFVGHAPPGALAWYTTSEIPDWHAVAGDRLESLTVRAS